MGSLGIKKEIMPLVKIYSTNTCAFCSAVKKFLTYKGIKYSEINLDEQPDKRAEAQKISGARSVPITYIKNGEKEAVVIGFNPKGIMAALV